MLCNKCHKDQSVYHRAYSGEYLCKNCFLHSIEEKMARTMNKYSMLKHNDRLAVSVSGGKDSLSLLYMMKKFFDLHGRSDLIAVTIDEGIRGYREESLQIVKNFCSNLMIE